MYKSYVRTKGGEFFSAASKKNEFEGCHVQPSQRELADKTNSQYWPKKKISRLLGFCFLFCVTKIPNSDFRKINWIILLPN